MHFLNASNMIWNFQVVAGDNDCVISKTKSCANKSTQKKCSFLLAPSMYQHFVQQWKCQTRFFCSWFMCVKQVRVPLKTMNYCGLQQIVWNTNFATVVSKQNAPTWSKTCMFPLTKATRLTPTTVSCKWLKQNRVFCRLCGGMDIWQFGKINCQTCDKCNKTLQIKTTFLAWRMNGATRVCWNAAATHAGGCPFPLPNYHLLNEWPLSWFKAKQARTARTYKKKHSAIKGKIALFKIQNCLVPDPQPKICPRYARRLVCPQVQWIMGCLHTSIQTVVGINYPSHCFCSHKIHQNVCETER